MLTCTMIPHGITPIDLTFTLAEIDDRAACDVGEVAGGPPVRWFIIYSHASHP